MPLPEQIPLWAYPLVALVAVAALIVWLTRLYAAHRARRAVESTISGIAYEMLRNVLIPNGMGGQIHVNYLLLTQRGVLVADLLDHSGAVFGGDQMDEWTVIGKKRRSTFLNPQHALYDRMAAVRLLTSESPVAVEGRLVFTARSEFPKGKPRHAIRIDELHQEYPPVDESAGNVAAAFSDVWSNVKQHAQANPLS